MIFILFEKHSGKYPVILLFDELVGDGVVDIINQVGNLFTIVDHTFTKKYGEPQISFAFSCYRYVERLIKI